MRTNVNSLQYLYRSKQSTTWRGKRNISISIVLHDNCMVLFLRFIQILIASGGICLIHWVTASYTEIMCKIWKLFLWLPGWKLGIWIFETLLIESYKLSDFLKYLDGIVLTFKHNKWNLILKRIAIVMMISKRQIFCSKFLWFSHFSGWNDSDFV